MKKIGLLVLAVILAMGSLGVAYARWFDTVTIRGTVNTGNVDINVIDYSGTWVYKDPADTQGRGDEMWYYQGPVTVPFEPPAGAFEVAYAVALPGDEDDEVKVEFKNLFPCVDFAADILLEYVGSIPVKVAAADITVDITKTDGTKAVVPGDVEVTITFKDATGADVDKCYQLHEDDTVYAVVTIHIPQTDADPNMDMTGASGTITGKVEVAQWNEPCLTNGEPPDGYACASPGTCGNFTRCNQDGNCAAQGGGYCFTTYDGTGACIADFWCSGPLQCSDGQCAAGEVCVVNSCCGVPLCAPAPGPGGGDTFCYPGMSDASAPAPDSPGGSGPTASGK